MLNCEICGQFILSEGVCCECSERALDIGLEILRKQKNDKKEHEINGQ